MTRYMGAQKLRTGVMEQWKEILNQGDGILDRRPKQGTGTTAKTSKLIKQGT